MQFISTKRTSLRLRRTNSEIGIPVSASSVRVRLYVMREPVCIPIRGGREAKPAIAGAPSLNRVWTVGDWWGTRLERLLAILGRCRTWNYLRNGSKGVDFRGNALYSVAVFYFSSPSSIKCVLALLKLGGSRVPRIVDDGCSLHWVMFDSPERVA